MTGRTADALSVFGRNLQTVTHVYLRGQGCGNAVYGPGKRGRLSPPTPFCPI